jgi:hypothetical protein
MTCQPASQIEATRALKALFTAFPAERSNGIGTAATYLIAVEGYSLLAIQKAVTRLIRGEFEWFSGRFHPTTAEVSRACRYCEDLIAPPRRCLLPAPGDIRDDSPAAVAQRQSVVERCRLTRFDWKRTAGSKPLSP